MCKPILPKLAFYNLHIFELLVTKQPGLILKSQISRFPKIKRYGYITYY
jgi:hypothetical protein